MLDFFFYYKYIVRFILILKKSEFKYNYTNIINLNKFIIYFNINNINDLNNRSILNYIYFFKYYFSVIPYFSNYYYKFHLNLDYYSFCIQYSFINKAIHYPLYHFVNDIYYMINRSYISLNKNYNFIEYKIIDMSFFVEKKNSIAFFNLKIPVNFKLIINNHNFFDYKNLLNLFKLKS